jgi:hypothetical protein
MNNIIYKYFPPERISVIENLKIRISQPNSLNDPFENKIIFNFEDALVNDRKYFEEMKMDKIAQDKLKSAITSSLIESTNRSIGMKFGIMSFSRTDSSLLMWAHYAKDYTGFVIGFDTNSPFFNTKIKGLNQQLQNVIYTSKRKQFFLDKMGINEGMLCTKPIEWSYEEEIRFIDVIEEDPHNCEKDQKGFPIILRDIPKSAVKEIILGYKSHISMQSKIMQLVRENDMETKIFLSILDQENYLLVKKEVIHRSKSDVV